MNDVGARAGASTPIPADRPVALLLRHAERPELPVGLPGDDVPLTPRGRREAQALGEALGARLSGLSTSPVRRCVETAEAIRDGAGLVAVARPDPMLGAPGAFVEDADLAWSTWLAWGHQAVIEALVGTRPTPPGFADPAPAARRLACHVVAELAGAPPGIRVFVTHDVVLGPLAAHLLGRARNRGTWPRFLQGAWLWSEGDRIALAYGDAHGHMPMR